MVWELPSCKFCPAKALNLTQLQKVLHHILKVYYFPVICSANFSVPSEGFWSPRTAQWNDAGCSMVILTSGEGKWISKGIHGWCVQVLGKFCSRCQWWVDLIDYLSKLTEWCYAYRFLGRNIYVLFNSVAKWVSLIAVCFSFSLQHILASHPLWMLAEGSVACDPLKEGHALFLPWHIFML